MKVIFHLDLDSYFISAHRTIDPSLNNKPVVISFGKRRSIVSAASYEAKNQGVKVPMPFYQALEKVPSLISVKPNYPLYTALSGKLFEFISSNYTFQLEVASIDECYIDVTKLWPKYGSPIKLAKEMQSQILKHLKLPVSIGIANNKFEAKMSTQINKPLGITVTKPGDFLKVFGSWELNKYHGIGNSIAKKLNKLGLWTINDLATANEDLITNALGKNGTNLIKQANGQGSATIDLSHNELKSVGNSITFQDYDRSEHSEISQELYALCSMVAHRAQNRSLVGAVIAVSFKTKGGIEVKKHSKQISLVKPINDLEQIFKIAMIIFDKLWDEKTIKFLEVSLNKLTNLFETTYQASLFEQETPKSKIETIVDSVNQKHQTKLVATGKEFKSNQVKKQNQSKYIESDKILKHHNK